MKLRRLYAFALASALSSGAVGQEAPPVSAESPPASPPEAATPAAPAAEPAASPMAAPPAAVATRQLRGQVIDAASREPIPLASVMVNTTPPRRVEADVEGRFLLTNLPDGPLVVRGFAADYLPLDVQVSTGQREVMIVLSTSYLEEIVVVGRATEVARKHLANAVATVKGEELNNAPAQTVESALQGKVSGANIQANSGAPGGGLQLRLRGVSTINGQSEPLYVVDGVLVSDVAIPSGINAVTRASGGSNTSSNQDGQVNRIADLNPEDVENIEILKGASAAAIYGSKASNGVVIITTKRGRAATTDEPRINFTQRVGVSSLANTLGSRRFTSVDEAVSVWGESARTYYQDGAFYDHERELAGRAAPSTETSISLSGTTPNGKTRYYASGLLRGDEGIITNTGYAKQSLRLNLDRRFMDRLDLRFSSNLVHSNARRGIFNNDNSGTSHYMVLPSTPSFMNLQQQADGTYPQNPFIPSLANPLQTAALMRNEEDVWRFMGAVDAVFDVWKGDNADVKLTAILGVDRFQQKNDLLFPPELHFEPVDDGLAGTSLAGTADNLNFNTGVNVIHAYRPKGSILSSAVTSVGFQQEERSLTNLYVVARDLNGGLQNVDTGTQVNLSQRRQVVRDRGFYLAEEALLLDERLSLSGAVRAEHSSVNGDPYALHWFPKVGGAYRLPVPTTMIDELKVRAAYGETGNLPIYGFKFTPLSSNVNIEGSAGIVSGGISGSKDIRPERQREIELGVDLIAFRGNGLLELTVYQRNISDLLLQRTLAPSTGYTTQFFNGGQLMNRGIELMLQATPTFGDVRWESRTTFALNRSQITDLPVPAFNTGGFGVSLGAFRIQEGASATQIVGNAGLNADGTCCVVRKLGDTEPDFRVGFSNAVEWKGLRLGFLLDWQQGSNIINLTRFLYDLGQNAPDWEAGNQRLEDWAVNYRTSVYIEDATFLKLREVTLSYELPRGLYSNWASVVKNARVSISGRNLLTFTNYSGLDPEVSNFGNQPIARNIDVAPFPPSRSFWGSIELGF